MIPCNKPTAFIGQLLKNWGEKENCQQILQTFKYSQKKKKKEKKTLARILKNCARIWPINVVKNPPQVAATCASRVLFSVLVWKSRLACLFHTPLEHVTLEGRTPLRKNSLAWEEEIRWDQLHHWPMCMLSIQIFENLNGFIKENESIIGGFKWVS